METLSFENRIQTRLRQLGISAKFLCAITGFSASALSQSMIGARRLDNQEGMRLLGALDRLSSIVRAVYPIPVELRSADKVRRLLYTPEEKLAQLRAAVIVAFGNESE